jgi:2-desacetyl-2-hydroxyethyl bacteriochlorophyllide A dehydrogenase
MRAFVVTAPGIGAVQDVPEPHPGAGEAVVEVERVGVCGTDVELFNGTMSYLHTGIARYPLRLGHEWAGTVSAVGAGVDHAWIGKRVMGDTMIGDGTCHRCRLGQHHVCENLREVGMRGYDGALAERIAVPVRSLHRLPDNLDAALGALVEPAGNSLRAARATQAVDGETVLVIGAGTIGLVAAMFLRAGRADVHVVDARAGRLRLARQLGFDQVWSRDVIPTIPYRAVIDASNDATVPAVALELVAPAGRLVYIGLAGEPSNIDTRQLALKDVTAVGILSASPALDDAIVAFASGAIDPRPLVATVTSLDRTGDVLAGWRPTGAGPGPKMHIDPRT